MLCLPLSKQRCYVFHCLNNDAMSSTVTWVVQPCGKVSKKVIINSFDECGITTDNAAKILCLRKEHDGADTEESTGTGNLGDIIDEDDHDNDEHES